MDVTATGAWTLDILTGSDWKFVSAAICTTPRAEVLATLNSHGTWQFIDDRFVPPAQAMSTTVTLEISNG